MSEHIRIISIELENYRPYYGKHKIDFSSRNEGFTIIAGKNGEGKSNLLNAISWCLFHFEPHGSGEDDRDHKSENKSLSVINNRYIKETKEETTASTSVKIWIQKGNNIYSISRVLTVLKHKLEYKELSGGKRSMLIVTLGSDNVPKGCEILDELGSFVVTKKGPTDADFHDTKTEGDPATIVKEILPQDLSKFFLLDGEFLEGFWKDSRIIQKGIEQISQLHLLSSAKDHVDKMRIPPTGIGRETDSLTSKIRVLAWYEQSLDNEGNEKLSEEPRWKENPDDDEIYYHATGNPRIKDLEDDIHKMESRLKDISAEIHKVGIPNIKTLKEKYDLIEKQFGEEKDNLKSLGRKYRYNLITKSPYIFLKAAIEDSVSIIEARMTLGDLPVRQKRQFADDLLERCICICGEKLDSKIIHDKETNEKRVIITNYRDEHTGKDDLDAAVDMRYDFTHDFIDNYDTFLKLNFGDPRKFFTASETKFDDLNNTLKGIRTQLGHSGDIGVEKLIDEQEHLLVQSKKLYERITSTKLTLALNAKSRGDTRILLDKALKKNETAKRLTQELDVWDKIFGHLHQVYEDLKSEIRIDVQENTWKNFNELLANPTEFESFTIEPDYSVYMLDKHDINKIRNLSPGQSLLLTLAFVAAIRGPTGYKFPLVVDSPLGKIDSVNRHNLGICLPEYLPDEQLTLLVLDTEYVADLPPRPGLSRFTYHPCCKIIGRENFIKTLQDSKRKIRHKYRKLYD